MPALLHETHLAAAATLSVVPSSAADAYIGLTESTCDGGTADAMNNLPERILEYAEAKPEATPIQAKSLPHLGDRVALARTLSRLVRSDRFLRICRGVHMRPIERRFGIRTPSLASAVTALGGRRGATIVSNGRSVANWQDLTTENAVHTANVPPGPYRLSRFGAQQVKLLDAPRWQLATPHGIAGTVIRAISWPVPTRARGCLMPCCRSSRSARVRFQHRTVRRLQQTPQESESRRWH